VLRRIFRAVGEASRVLLGRKPAGRALTVFPDDIFIVSYPRSGNTWTRFLIGNLVYHGNPVTFANVEARIPEIYLFPDRILRSLPRPRMLKSHECFDPRYKRTIYIVRDPRDVAVSYYHYAIKRKRIASDYPIEEFVHRFIAAEFDIHWGWAASWIDHVASWIAVRQGHEGFLLLRYEDMLAHTEQELAKVASFLNLESMPQRLARAVELSSADHMRTLEKRQARDWALTKATRQDKPFVRAATSGGWRAALTSQSIAEIESAWGTAMRNLGYALSAESPTASPVDNEPVRSGVRKSQLDMGQRGSRA
jgi:hypothetical protein